jgi:hypothetical protein
MFSCDWFLVISLISRLPSIGEKIEMAWQQCLVCTSNMQTTVRTIRNHSRGFVTPAQAHRVAKRQATQEKMAATTLHKKTVSKGRRARKPYGFDFFETESQVFAQPQTVAQRFRTMELEQENHEMILAKKN